MKNQDFTISLNFRHSILSIKLRASARDGGKERHPLELPRERNRGAGALAVAEKAHLEMQR